MDNVLADSSQKRLHESHEKGIYLSDNAYHRPSSPKISAHRATSSKNGISGHDEDDTYRGAPDQEENRVYDRRSYRGAPDQEENRMYVHRREDELKENKESRFKNVQKGENKEQVAPVSVHEDAESEIEAGDEDKLVDDEDGEGGIPPATKPRLNQTTGIMLRIFGDTLYPAGVESLGTYFDAHGNAFCVYKFESEHVKTRTFQKLVSMEKESRREDTDCVQGGDVRVGSAALVDFALAAIPKYPEEKRVLGDILAMVLVYKQGAEESSGIRAIGFRGPKDYLRPTLTAALLRAATSKIDGVMTHVPKHSVGFAAQTGFIPASSCLVASLHTAQLGEEIRQWNEASSAVGNGGDDNVWDSIARKMKARGLAIDTEDTSSRVSDAKDIESDKVVEDHRAQFKMIFCWGSGPKESLQNKQSE